jgi:uncharacterized glyoxalase superfamily protein PhnB
MKAKTASPAFTTEKVAEARDFYVRHFGAEVTFDCGWYVNLRFGDDGATIQFMSPQAADQKTSCGDGLGYNFEVEDVDAEHERLVAEGLDVVMPLEDHPWGDRGFSVVDPHGISLYVYSPRPPTKEFEAFYASVPGDR